MIREILIAADAPERDLDWLVASCPSIRHAQMYTAPTTPEESRRLHPLPLREQVGWDL